MTNEKKMALKLERSELEDKYMKLQEENIELKKNSLKQEEKIKRLGTKLLRLINDKKRQDNGIAGRKQDIQLEEIIQDLQDQNRELTKQNKQIKEKLLATKQQLATCSKRPSPYHHIQPRVDSGKNKGFIVHGRASPSSTYRDVRKTGASSPLPRYGLSLLEEARTENRNLEEVVQTLREQTYVLEQENESLREQLRIKDADFTEEIENLKTQMTNGQKKNIQGNVDMIRLQRELKHKTSQLVTIEEEKNNMVHKVEVLKSSNQELVSDIERLNKHLQELQNRNLEFDSQIKTKTSIERNLQQCQEQLNDLKRENIVLKEINDKLMNSSLDLRPTKENNVVEQSLRKQVAKLQEMLANNYQEIHSSPVMHSSPVIEQIASPEEGNNLKLQNEYDDLLVQHKKLKDENEEMNEKLKILSESSIVNISDLEHALSVVKLNKEHGSRTSIEVNDSEKKKIKFLETQNVETLNELEKTRNMLILQHRINRDYQAEVEMINQQKIQLQSEFETRLQEYAKLLDIRAARIQKLERQLKDVAYGTKQYQISDAVTDYEVEETVQLERGQNLFELHIDKVTISSDGLHILQDREPSTFLTWAFYDYQLITTPIIKGHRPEFNYTAQYIIRADDSFLEYLLKMKTVVELHMATGMDYITVATCNLNLRPILDDTQSRYHGKSQLLVTTESKDGIVIGNLEFWARLRIPMEQAVRLFKERGKALGYVAANHNTTKSALTILDSSEHDKEKQDNTNEVHIKIIRCNNLSVSKEKHQPSPFCVYTFYNTPDHDTAIIPATNDPEFNDHKIVPVVMNQELDNFLKSKNIQIYVFDDTDPVLNNYIGFADIPLVSLIHNRAINGSFEMCSENGTICGTIEVCIYFQYTYLSPLSRQTVIPVLIERDKSVSEPSDNNVNQPETIKNSEVRDELSDTIIAGDACTNVTPTPQPRNRNSGPVAVSTPVISRTSSEEKSHSSSRALRFSDSVDASSPNKIPKPEAAPRRSSLRLRDESEKVNGSKALQSSPTKSGNLSSDETNQNKAVSNKLADELKQRSPRKSAQSSVESPKATQIHTQELSDDESIDSLKEDLKTAESSEASDSEGGHDAHTHAKSVTKKDSISTSESDDVVVKAPQSPRISQKDKDTITIVIHHLTLTDDSSVLKNSKVQMLFVEYRFLNFSPEELETPFALPKPKSGQKIAFHFNKVFHVDAVNNYSKRQMLAAMILPNSSDIIQFTVVSEPPDDNQEEMDCEDVGYASVSLKQILNSGDLKEMDIAVFDVKGNAQIGNLNLTVEAADVLNAIKSEMKTTSSSSS